MLPIFFVFLLFLSKNFFLVNCNAQDFCAGEFHSCLLQSCCPPFRCENSNNGNRQCVSRIPITTRATTTTPRPNNNTKCPYSPSIEQILQPVALGEEEFERTIAIYKKFEQSYILASAFRGDPDRNFRTSLRNIHLEMRKYYSTLITGVGNNIYPLIIASDQANPGSVSGIGGTFSLYLEDGTMKQITPTSPDFEMMKNLAHIPLGIFSIVSPYFRIPQANGWKGPLEEFLKSIEIALQESRLNLTLSADLRRRSFNMLEITVKHCRIWLNNPSNFNGVEHFKLYTREMFPYVQDNIAKAAEFQMNATLPEISKWRKELGEKWKDVYALIPTVWPVSATNPRLQVLSKFMSPEQVRNQVLMLENGGNLQEMRRTLGRIVADRAAALLIFGTDSPRGKTLTFNLSGRQDLLATDAARAKRQFN